MMNGMFGGMWLSWLLGLALVFLLIWAVVRVINNPNSTQRRSPDDDPVEILRRRLARGEIDEREFDEKRKLLI
jgi:putative membrane protein